MRWFRFYDDALNDPKVQRLSPHLFRTWINLLCLASKGDGRLPTVADVAFNLRMSENDAKSAIEDLILAELIDIGVGGAMTPHNWSARQFSSDNSKNRTRKWREKNDKAACDVTVTADVTPSDEIGDGIEAEAEAEAEQSRSRAEQTRESEVLENKFSGKGSRAVSARLKARAEGLGANVDVLEQRAMLPDVRVPNAMFRKLVADELRGKNPRITEALVKAALTNSNDAAYGTLCQMLVEFA